MAFIYLFLDIDGVLNHSKTRERYKGCTGVDPECLSNLIEVLIYFRDARIVISSTWRLHNSLEEISILFGNTMNAIPAYKGKYDGVEFFRKRIIGQTPRDGDSRGAEISEWLKENANISASLYKKSSDGVYVAIDDSIGDVMTHLNAYHVLQTRYMYPFKGLESSHVKELSKLITFQLDQIEESKKSC